MLVVGKECVWASVFLMNLDASSGKINIIPVDTTVGAEVSIHTLGAIGIGMVALFVFLICIEHLFLNPCFVLGIDSCNT